MRFLPFPNAARVGRISEVIFIAGLLQPGLLTGSFPDFLTLGFQTEALAAPVPVIRKKNYIAVQAIAVVLLRLHQFPNPTNQNGKNRRRRPRKSKRRRRVRTAKKEEKLSANPAKKNQPKKIHVALAGFAILPSCLWHR